MGNKHQPNQNNPIHKSMDKNFNGSFTSKGNYAWGGALTLAWKQLASEIIKEPIK